MKSRMIFAFVISATVFAFAGGSDQEEKISCPMHAEHMKNSDAHYEGVLQRGEKGMGFDQLATTHHFRLAKDGGAIEVTADDLKDAENIAEIRAHLKHIAAVFAQGDFSIPMFVHDQTPPGVQTMKRLRKQISYKYEELEGGARVAISTQNDEALKAVQEFLRFQVSDHRTHD
jgi:hypothetical protein